MWIETASLRTLLALQSGKDEGGVHRTSIPFLRLPHCNMKGGKRGSSNPMGPHRSAEKMLRERRGGTALLLLGAPAHCGGNEDPHPPLLGSLRKREGKCTGRAFPSAGSQRLVGTGELECPGRASAEGEGMDPASPCRAAEHRTTTFRLGPPQPSRGLNPPLTTLPGGRFMAAPHSAVSGSGCLCLWRARRPL